jgi:hypothetical protein
MLDVLHGMNLKPEMGGDFKYKSTMKVLVLEKENLNEITTGMVKVENPNKDVGAW